MHQLINKRKIYFYLLSFVFLTTVFNSNIIKTLKNNFKIADIKIEINNNEIEEILLLKTKFLIDKNIFFVEKKLLKEDLKNLKFLESFKVLKQYPSTIKIKAKKTKLIAITYINQNKYYLGLNNKFIQAKEISNNQNLPVIFGKFKASDYILHKEKLIQKNIDQNKITKFYFHKNQRWDLYFENNILLQLPSKNISEALELFNQFKENKKFNPNSIIDLRIKGRLIFKDG